MMRSFSTAARVMGAAGLLAMAPLQPAGAEPDADADTAEIVIAAGPCFGRCPVYSTRILADGGGRFIGTRFVAKVGEQALLVEPATFRAIEKRLAPYRPAADRRIGPEECESFRTDAPSWTVRWVDKSGEAVTLSFSLGCTDLRYVPLAEAIRSSNEMLPIGPLVGDRPR
ncbi:DUF6438 domain-containing protein [Sphingomonas fennica]|nr:DUF6438 domain-containing protein [Sphingomonas fennica]